MLKARQRIPARLGQIAGHQQRVAGHHPRAAERRRFERFDRRGQIGPGEQSLVDAEQFGRFEDIPMRPQERLDTESLDALFEAVEQGEDPIGSLLEGLL